MFFGGHKNPEQKAPKNSSETLVTFFSPKIFISAFSLSIEIIGLDYKRMNRRQFD
jgi:hypothetical protein